MAVLHEVTATHPVHLDGRKGHTAPLDQGQMHPAGPQPVGRRAEPAVEIAARVERADDRVQPYRLQAQTAFATPAERPHRLMQRHQLSAVAALIVALAMIAFELVTLAWIRWRFFSTGFLRSFVSIALGGAIIASVSAALGAVS